MIGRLRSTRQRLGVAAALAFMLSVAGPTASGAAPSNASGYANGLPCNDICKAYMAWSDRVMAKLRPSPQSRPKARMAIRPGKPDRTADRVSKTRRSDLNSFARVLRPSDTPAQAPQVAQTPQVTIAAPSGPVEAIEQRLSPAARGANARFAEANDASNEPPERTLVSLTAPVSATQDPQDTGTTDDVAHGSDWLLRASLGLAICALLSLLYWGWSRDRTLA